ncbi:MAG: hypothetical protein M2R45_02539 [Verrucomicrobia subdivision 3 bacterium]|nr:hypothetical protein [Limisphaerales bacterium]MCS1414253.1 hypothetical protein [Limisphaerales bacterium]
MRRVNGNVPLRNHQNFANSCNNRYKRSSLKMLKRLLNMNAPSSANEDVNHHTFLKTSAPGKASDLAADISKHSPSSSCPLTSILTKTSCSSQILARALPWRIREMKSSPISANILNGANSFLHPHNACFHQEGNIRRRMGGYRKSDQAASTLVSHSHFNTNRR